MNALTVTSDFSQTMSLCEVLAKSGYFADTRSTAQAVVKVLAGAELGFGPIASMTGVHIIEGKPSVGAHLMAAMIKRSGRYDYDLLHCSREICEVEFFEVSEKKRKSLGKTQLTMAEAMQSGLAIGKDGKSLKSNWARSSDDMLFARCITKGYRRFCPDLTGGCPVYDPDELDRLEATPSQIQQLTNEAVAEIGRRDVQPGDVQRLITNVTNAAIEEGHIPKPPEVVTIDDIQKETLNQLARTGLKERPTIVSDFLKHFGIKVLIQLPRSRFEEAKSFFVQSKPLTSSPSSSAPAAASTAAPAVGESIDQDQFNVLKGLIETHKIDPKALLDLLGVERFGQVQAAWFHWIRLTLPEKPDWFELRKTLGITSFAATPQARIDGMTRAKLMQRIDDLFQVVGITAEQWNTRLQELFGTTDSGSLTLAQLAQLEARLADYAAKKRGAA